MIIHIRSELIHAIVPDFAIVSMKFVLALKTVSTRFYFFHKRRCSWFVKEAKIQDKDGDFIHTAIEIANISIKFKHFKIN